MKSRGDGESGNAILGFAIAAPIVSLLVVALINVAATGWHRELLAHAVHTVLVTQSRAQGTSDSVRSEILRISHQHKILNPEVHVMWRYFSSGKRMLLCRVTGELPYAVIGDRVQFAIEDMVMFE